MLPYQMTMNCEKNRYTQKTVKPKHSLPRSCSVFGVTSVVETEVPAPEDGGEGQGHQPHQPGGHEEVGAEQVGEPVRRERHDEVECDDAHHHGVGHDQPGREARQALLGERELRGVAVLRPALRQPGGQPARPGGPAGLEQRDVRPQGVVEEPEAQRRTSPAGRRRRGRTRTSRAARSPSATPRPGRRSTGRCGTRPSHRTRKRTNEIGRNAADASAMRRSGWLQRDLEMTCVAANRTPACDRPGPEEPVDVVGAPRARRRGAPRTRSRKLAVPITASSAQQRHAARPAAAG